MEVEKKKITHDVISNLFYYLFLVLIVAITILSFILDIELINSIFIITLIITSLVIIFYIAFQMLRYNYTIEKRVQLGILLIVVGFVLVLASLSKEIDFGNQFLSDLLGETLFIYWGIGSIAIGIFTELTLIDQWLWNLFITPLKYIWKALVVVAKFIRKHWKSILLYTLDILSIALIIAFSIRWDWLEYFSWIPIGVAIIYLIVHHAKRIWRVIKFIAVDIVYSLLVFIGKTIKRFFVSIFEFLKKHWLIFTKETSRLIGVGLGIFLIVWGAGYLTFEAVASRFNESNFIWIGIAVIIISQIFSRKVIVVGLYNALVSLIKSIVEFVKKYKKQILLEFIRLIFLILVIIGMTTFRIPMNPLYYWLQFSAGLLVAISAQILSRKRVWIWILRHKTLFIRFLGACLVTISLVRTYYFDVGWDGVDISFLSIGLFGIVFAWVIVNPLKVLKFFKRAFIEIGLFFYRLFKFIWDSIKRMFIRIWEFVKIHYKRILFEILRLAIVVVSIILMVWTYLPIFAGVIIILFAEIIIRKFVLRFLRRVFTKLAIIFRNLMIAIKEFFIKYHVKVLIEIGRLIVCALGVFFIVWAWGDLTFPAVAVNFNEANFAWIGFAVILLIQLVLRRFFLQPIFEFIKQFIEASWEIFKAIFYKPIKFIVLKTIALLKFLAKHWVKVILYTLDIAAIVAIIFFSIRWDILELLTIIILVGCGVYLIVHHYLSIWKAIKFIAVDIFYRSFKGIYNFFKLILTKFWNAIKAILEFMATHWLRILKEFLRLLGVAAGIYLVYHGYNNAPIETERIFTIIGFIVIPVSLIFTRVAVWKSIYKGLKKFVLGIIKWFENVFETVWLTIKTVTHYVATNFLRLVLLLFMIFTFICGIALMAGFKFWGLFETLTVPYRLSIGGILLVVAIGSLFLFRRQLQKLRTGESRILFRDIKEAWKK